MNITEIKAALETLTATAEAKYGKTADGAIILDDAHHACAPDRPDLWKASAVLIDGDKVTIGDAFWDFAGIEKDEEDPSGWDWSDSDFKAHAGPYEINEAADRESIAFELHLA